MKRLGIVVVALVIAAVVVYFGAWRPFDFRGRQIGDMVLLRHYRYVVDEFKKQHGIDPSTLEAAFTLEDPPYFKAMKDSWGHQLVYESDGGQFVLIAHGMDGTGDGPDNLTRHSIEARRVCGDWNADLVLSDAAELRTCGK